MWVYVNVLPVFCFLREGTKGGAARTSSSVYNNFQYLVRYSRGLGMPGGGRDEDPLAR